MLACHEGKSMSSSQALLPLLAPRLDYRPRLSLGQLEHLGLLVTMFPNHGVAAMIWVEETTGLLDL